MKKRIIFDSFGDLGENENIELWYEDEKTNLDKYLAGNIIAIADLGLWNGRVNGYKVMNNNLSSILEFFHCDYIRVYQDRYNIKSDCIHHDGINHILFRMLRPELTYNMIDNFEEKMCTGKLTSRDLRKYTVSLNTEIDNIYGKIKL